jgi:hypothetical protein
MIAFLIGGVLGAAGMALLVVHLYCRDLTRSWEWREWKG